MAESPTIESPHSADPHGIDKQSYREVLTRFATGVTVVTTLEDGADGPQPWGTTVNSFTGISLEPPLVMVCDRPRAVDPPDHRAHRPLRRQHPGRGLAGAVRLFRRCAVAAAASRCSATLPYTLGESGLPVLDAAIAYLSCDVEQVIEAGDHTMYLGRVVETGCRDEIGWPLLYFRRRYLSIERAATPDLRGKPDNASLASQTCRTIRANGIDVSYTVEGAGPPLVMLHGATSSSAEDWSAQRPLFRKAFRVYLVDARGHGGTKWDVRDGFDRDMLVDDLLAFVDALGLATFHVVGFSMGAMTALTFATRYPERLRTAIICGIDIVREPRTSVAKRLMDPERIEREEPEWAAQLEKRHGPVQGEGAWQRLLPAIADDVVDCAAPDARGSAPHSTARPAGLRRP